MVISFGTFRIHVTDLIFTHFFESVHKFVRNETYVCKDMLINGNKVYWVHCAESYRNKIPSGRAVDRATQMYPFGPNYVVITKYPVT
jgi:hypothetical protein